MNWVDVVNLTKSDIVTFIARKFKERQFELRTHSMLGKSRTCRSCRICTEFPRALNHTRNNYAIFRPALLIFWRAQLSRA
jgi:hypothetical protein